jgi:adenosylcobinamide-GDP ribazoletransferase
VRSLTFAIRTLTRLPIGSGELEREERSLLYYPLVGALYGALYMALSFVPLPASIRGALVIALYAYLSRGFHLDGLSDFADGLGGGWTAERALAIMRDSHIGAFGTIALIVALLVQYSALLTLVDFPLLLFYVPVAGRLMVVLAASFLPYAREGEGSASRLVRGAKRRHAIAPLVQVLLLTGVYWYVGSGLEATAALVFSLVAALVVMALAKRRLGGVTGDVLGAVEVVAECAAMVGLLIPLA